MATDYSKLAASAKKMVDYLSTKGVKVALKSSRYQAQIKAVEIAFSGTLDAFLKTVGITATVTDLTPTEEKAISGKYKAKLMTLTKVLGTIAKGETFYIVNTYTEKGTLKTKELAPEKFNLTTSKYTTLESLDKAVLTGIKENATLPSDIKVVLTELYKTVSTNKNPKDIIPMTTPAKKSFAGVKPQDKQAIGKDFGEVLSMRWYLTQPFASTWQQAFFSDISNEALVDFVVMKKSGKETIRTDISAKFEAGAAPSIGAIVTNIDKVYKAPNKDEAIVINVLKALAGENDNTSTKILAAMKSLNLPAYTTLKKTIGAKGNFTIQDISAHIQQIAKVGKTDKARIKLFKSTYEEFYNVLGKNASDDSVNIVMTPTTYKKYYSLVMAPMGYALVDYMNKQPQYQEVLNKISQYMKTEQVYLNFSGDNLEFKKKLFSKAEFKFAYGANAKDSDNTGIKFSMK